MMRRCVIGVGVLQWADLFFKQKAAYEMRLSLGGSEMWIRDGY